MAITLFVLYLTLRLSQAQAKKSELAPRKIEYLSAALLLLAVAVPLFALNLGGEIFPWSHPVVIFMFCLTPVLIALFYYAETRIAITSIVPKRFIQNKHVVIALACTLPMKFVFDQVSLQFDELAVAHLCDYFQLRFSFSTY